MSAAAVKAGEAYGELTIRDKTAAALAAAKKRFGAFVGQVKSIAAGVGVAAITGKVFAGFQTLFGKMTDVGATLDDLSQRTGFGVESLSALSYAARMTGTSLDAVGKGATALSKFSLALQSGNKGAAKTMRELGIDSAAFLAASPEGKFAMIADALSRIEDPTIRAGMAMKVLGKSAMELGPMLFGGSAALDKLFNEARASGAIVTAETAQAAAELGDAWDRIYAIWDAVAANAGGAMSNALIVVLETGAAVLTWVSEFVKNNQGLITVLGIAGMALVAAATGVSGLAFAATVAAAAWSALSAIVAFTVSPLGLVVIAVAAVSAGLAYLIGRALYSAGVFSALSAVLGGVGNAIAAGRWDLAGTIALAALEVAFASGVAGLKSLWTGFSHWLYDTLLALAQAAAELGSAIGAGEWFDDAVAGLKQSRRESAARTKRDSAANSRPVVEATNNLKKALTEAAKARDDKRAAIKLPNLAQTVAKPLATEASRPGASLGEFQLSGIAYLSSRMPDSFAERTADASEKSADHLAKIEDRLDEMDGAAFGD